MFRTIVFFGTGFILLSFYGIAGALVNNIDDSMELSYFFYIAFILAFITLMGMLDSYMDEVENIFVFWRSLRMIKKLRRQSELFKANDALEACEEAIRSNRQDQNYGKAINSFLKKAFKQLNRSDTNSEDWFRRNTETITGASFARTEEEILEEEHLRHEAKLRAQVVLAR